MKASVLSPEQAFDQSRDMLTNLTGRQSPDILLVASCMWCVLSTGCVMATLVRKVGIKLYLVLDMSTPCGRVTFIVHGLSCCAQPAL